MIRKIIEIDEERCDGCGLCAAACAEGAIQVIEGKARLMSDSYCDGLGACIGECPQDAITIVEREARAFDEKAVERRIAAASSVHPGGDHVHSGAGEKTIACGCPGSMARELRVGASTPAGEGSGTAEHVHSRLRNWPVQLHLVPVHAPYLRGARLLLAADCTGFALAALHRLLLDGRILLIGCPKLDDAAAYRDKLAAILRDNDIQSMTVAFMEVPCCFGLVNLARQAISDSGKDIPFAAIKVGIEGTIIEVEGEPSCLPA
ncbi:MAG: 4Fe-4S ferredoxin [Actinobacteria bacterium]|jgi:Pyruvate/2-oxoacid:ferredoxin oxidoreductase delta subunit|nr:MAG: 4Fe-4S ferredoxin [Actinomycetota bacterium]